MRTHAEIIKAAGTAEQVATARGVSIHTIRSWIQRNKVPDEYWAGVARDGWASLDELAIAAERVA